MEGRALTGRFRRALRIIDANLNRAREAARVAEEYARFALDSAAHARRLKEARHDLRELAEMFDGGTGRVVAARDTAGDVGTQISTPSEARRDTPADVAAAALKRLQEALRVIEEYGKTECPAAAARAEALRYRIYTIETELSAPRRLADARLCVIVTAGLCGGRDPVEVARAAIRGGAGMIQLREKEMDGADFLALAKRLRGVTAEAGAVFVVNDRADIAAASDADGVHLGQTDLGCAEARRLLGAGAVIGVSAGSVEQARQAAQDGADYVGVGAVFATETKAGANVRGLELVRTVTSELSVPVYAIGGIRAENVGSVVAAGAGRVAVCSGIISAGDVEAAARDIKEQLPSAAAEDAADA